MSRYTTRKPRLTATKRRARAEMQLGAVITLPLLVATVLLWVSTFDASGVVFEALAVASIAGTVFTVIFANITLDAWSRGQ